MCVTVCACADCQIVKIAFIQKLNGLWNENAEF